MEYWDDYSTRWAVVKKGGSTTLGNALRPESVGGQSLHRFVTIIRHPFARLVSGYVDLARDRGHNFGRVSDEGMKDFNRFAIEICEKPDNELDHHYRSQVFSINMVMDKTKLEIGGQLYIGVLEHLDEHIWPRLEKFKRKEISHEHRRKSSHSPWPRFYTDASVHRAVANRFHDDLELWRHIVSIGGWYESSQYLDWKTEWHNLLNARQK